jgi:two-component system, OmpR family, sensor kinase
LLLWLLPPMLLALGAAALLSFWQALGAIDALFDRHLKQTAVSLRNQITLDAAALELAQGLARDTGASIETDQVLIQIHDHARNITSASNARIALPIAGESGYADTALNGEVWRTYALATPERTVQVSQPLGQRTALSASVAARKLLPFVLLVPAIGAIAWFAVGRSLRPLDRLVRDIEQRNAGALDPLAIDVLPRELQPLGGSLNGLLARLAHALDAHRSFCADAAHELRTPLTALRLQAQLLERLQEPSERREAISALGGGLQRASHVVEQLLTMARLDPDSPRTLSQIDLDRLAKAVVAEHSPIAEARNIDLGVGHASSATVNGEAEGLRTMLANLVDNALRYTPAGGRVDVNVYGDARHAKLEVVDTGPGIAPCDRALVFDRFRRGEHNGETGSGLGLAIVKRVAERHDARIELGEGEDGRGLKVAIEFPAAA